jgi:hypothetical protein
MRLNLTINCDNAAFDERNEEVGRILRDVVGMIESGGVDAGPRTLRDHNGNTVGTVEFVTNARGE